MNDLSKKKKIIKFSKLFNKNNISPIRSGNISIRHKYQDTEGFLITPSGKKNSKINTKDIVFVSMNGVAEKKKKPSSEWRFHLDLYKNTKFNSIVHAHSKFSVICSCLYTKIPSFHYMIALTGSKNINVAKYALFGSKKLSKNILEAIKNSRSCLISNHGQISLGDNIEEAFELCEEIELICEYYYFCRLQKVPKNINTKEMNKVLNKIFNYKN
ncbi:MAG: class II aldolase [Rickettsiales bacterium]|nr:class II aldolase [Rickettsiales bacterium]